MANTAYIPEPTQPARKKWYKTWWGVSGILLTPLIVIGGALLGLQVQAAYRQIQMQTQQLSDPAALIAQFATPGPYADEAIAVRPTLGSAAPKVTIVEFFDFNCPHCKNSFPTIRQIMSEHDDSVKLIMRYYPVTADSSLDLALAGQCAYEQGLFWNMHDRFFQSSDPASHIAEIARQSGLNMTQFNTCLSSQKYFNIVKQDIAATKTIGAAGTPAWLINGHLISGEIPHDIFVHIVNTLVETAN
jgi:protein-disulfide isomerase